MSANGDGLDPARSERVRRIGDELIAILKEHEDRYHGGERCKTETVNVLAFLCHVTGLHLDPDAPDDVLAAFRDLVLRAGDYNAIHGEHHL